MDGIRKPAQVYFDDVAEGFELPPLRKGPLTTVHLMRWSAAMENWHKIHYDHPFAVGHDRLPGLLVNGSFKQQFILQHLKDFAGLAGWAWKARFQFRAMDVAGTTLDVWARVKRRIPMDDYGLVELDLGIRNQDGHESTPGEGLVALPYRGRGAVPYPFVPPAGDPWARRAG
ncbi:acyl dehydratase [Bordetella genomosp. 10]|uniref:Acyl dehydratase n=1 Tax=Bordetella genomosp. 10 TaxID=1416804 RepID=A0A261SBA9_9BORD|nr:acyl dehydratase [Bordetella genomosp. 10]OZI34242.1 acyl dehydratase [Bordetella genomosp. 10]